MSTALLSRSRFNDILRGLVHHGTDAMHDTGCSMKNSNIARTLGVDYPFGGKGRIEVAEKAKVFVFDLARLNHAAVVARYDPFPPEPKVPKFCKGKVLNLCALLKALHCVRYNCDGGKLPNASMAESLKRLDEVIQAIADTIIDDLPEYQAAEWF